MTPCISSKGKNRPKTRGRGFFPFFPLGSSFFYVEGSGEMKHVNGTGNTERVRFVPRNMRRFRSLIEQRTLILYFIGGAFSVGAHTRRVFSPVKEIVPPGDPDWIYRVNAFLQCAGHLARFAIKRTVERRCCFPLVFAPFFAALASNVLDKDVY